MKSTLMSIALLFLFVSSVSAGDIDSCKYLLVGDFDSDPYGIAQELRAQARAKGFIVVSARNEIPEADLFKTCVMKGSWSATGFGGNLSVRVIDAVSGALIAEAVTGATAWWTVSRTVRGGVRKVYEKLRYSGYKQDVWELRMKRLYPTRPKLSVTEAEIKEKELGSRIEGIWTDPEDRYRLGIVGAPQGSDADYVAVVLRSDTPVWQTGEIKAEIRTTASPNTFTCTYFMLNKQPAGTTLTLERNAVLRGSLSAPTGPKDLLLIRVWPGASTNSELSTSAKTAAHGTGFLVSRSGLIATNWHVVANAKKIEITFPEWKDSFGAQIVIKDEKNDLAVLRIADSTKLTTVCPEFPFQLTSSSRITLGERVSTIGYPLESILGSNPKFSAGVVTSKTGWQDDPRTLQVSAEVQPGSSGGPLFDGEGNIVGVVFATLDAATVFQAAGILPQNVNWAIKSDYLLNLLNMLPGEALASRETSFSPEKASKCVANVRVW